MQRPSKSSFDLWNLSQKARGYRFLEHITDAEIEAYGSNLDEAFENAGKALEDTMVDIKTIRPELEEKITLRGRDKQELLYQLLEHLISKQETEGMLYSNFICKISRKNAELTLESTIRGEKYDSARHEQKTAIKAPTFHEMIIDEKSVPVKIHFLLDL
jgi:SHS2 domain-containing protein